MLRKMQWQLGTVLVLLMSSVVPAMAQADFQPQAFFTSRFISPCDSFWNWLRTDSGSGYVCSSPGRMLEVPESQSLARVINDLEARIQALEGRIKQLESQSRK